MQLQPGQQWAAWSWGSNCVATAEAEGLFKKTTYSEKYLDNWGFISLKAWGSFWVLISVSAAARLELKYQH